MTPVTFPSQLAIQGVPYKVPKEAWNFFVNRLIENNWTLEDEKIPLEADYDNITTENCVYMFFHPEHRFVAPMSKQEYKDSEICMFIYFVR